MESSRENFEMSDTRDNGTRTKSSFISRPSVLLIGTNIILSFVILIIVILVFSGQKSSNDAGTESQSSGNKMDQSDLTVLERFPGYFRTYEEQEKLEQSLRRRIPVNDTFDSANCTVGLNIPSDIPWCVLTPPNEDFHSCCVTKIRYESPEFKVDYEGVNRTLAVFGKQRQFFRTETCGQVSGCKICICRIEEVLYTGVYDTGKVGSNSRYGVAFFNFNGCCKCYNE